MATVWFSIGSNINKDTNVPFAISQLNKQFGNLILSPVYQTKAVGFIGNDFYNMVGGFDTDLQIIQLRRLFDHLEQQTGRIKTGRHFESRTLDIDILLYDRIEFADERISIPHPDILEYDFILLPLSELIPDYIHPQTGQSLAQIGLQKFKDIKLKTVEL